MRFSSATVPGKPVRGDNILARLDHKIELTDRVAKYIPEVAKYGDGLRIEHLVYMTSGLHDSLFLGKIIPEKQTKLS
ncbi:MAG TPA: hypothetical protein VNB49_01340 [Candidatus Dormibacteraeota bacterium]|nr:hypothetical protein [Candidatus Dormibacteraeota bacterium]